MVKKVILFFAGIVIVVVVVRFGYMAVNNGLNMGGKVINNSFKSVFGTDQDFIGHIEDSGDSNIGQSGLGDLGNQQGMDDLFK